MKVVDQGHIRNVVTISILVTHVTKHGVRNDSCHATRLSSSLLSTSARIAHPLLVRLASMGTCVQDPSRQIKERIELCIDQIDAVHAAGTYPLSKTKIRLRLAGCCNAP